MWNEKFECHYYFLELSIEMEKHDCFLNYQEDLINIQFKSQTSLSYQINCWFIFNNKLFS